VAPAAAAAAAAADVLVLIGMRGCGKTANGKAVAAALGCAFVDLDDVLEEEVGSGINAFVEKHDWPTFRAKEAEILVGLGCIVASYHLHPLYTRFTYMFGASVFETSLRPNPRAARCAASHWRACATASAGNPPSWRAAAG
jgi:hypothetical protein